MVISYSLLIIFLAAIVIFIIGAFIIRLSHFSKKIKLFIIIVIVLFLYFSISGTIVNENIKLNSFEGYSKAVSLFLGTIVSSIKSTMAIGKDSISFVGDVVKGNFTI